MLISRGVQITEMFAQPRERMKSLIHMQVHTLIKQCEILNALIQIFFLHYPLYTHIYTYCTVGQKKKDTDNESTWRYSDPGTQTVTKHIPGIKGHISRESVCGRLAKEEAYAAVEAVSVWAAWWRRCGGGLRTLLQQGQGVGRAVTQGVRATAQLLAAVWVHTVHQPI